MCEDSINENKTEKPQHLTKNRMKIETKDVRVFCGERPRRKWLKGAAGAVRRVPEGVVIRRDVRSSKNPHGDLRSLNRLGLGGKSGPGTGTR